MFDIIDLNETERSTKSSPETTTIAQEITQFKPIKKWLPKSEKIEKEVNEQKPKSSTKIELYKNSDPKRRNFTPARESVNRSTQTTEKYSNTANENTDINREFSFYPIIKNESIFLKRTFRKQLPNIKKYELADNEEVSVQDVSNDVGEKMPDMQFENLPQNINLLTPNGFSKPEPVTTDIDPKIDILNNNVSTHDNESEIIEFVAPSEIGNKTFDDDIFANQFSSKNLDEQNIPNLTTSGKSNTTEEPLEKDQTNPEDQPRPNRQRQLTRPQRKTFYPYFFSRVLG